MPERTAYEASQIDWERLRAYAQRVARETGLPPRSTISYSKSEWIAVPVEQRSGGLFDLGARTKVVHERRKVDQAIEALGPHWCLDHRQWHLEDVTKRKDGRTEEVTHEQHTLALLSDGGLVKVVVSETEVLVGHRSVGRGYSRYQDFAHSVRQAGERDVILLDFGKEYSESARNRSGKRAWGDRERGRRLLRHAKGVGINLALKAVLESRSPDVRQCRQAGSQTNGVFLHRCGSRQKNESQFGSGQLVHLQLNSVVGRVERGVRPCVALVHENHLDHLPHLPYGCLDQRWGADLIVVLSVGRRHVQRQELL